MPLPLLALIPLAAGVASGGMSIFGGLQAEKASDAQSDYLDAVGRAQAQAYRRAAKAEEYTRQQKAASVADEQIRRRATMEAGYSKAGVTMSGTPGTVLAAQAAVDQQNLQQLNVASYYEQRALRIQAGNAKAEARNLAGAARAQGDAARMQGITSGVTQIVGAVGGAATSGAFAGGGGAGASAPALDSTSPGGGGLGAGMFRPSAASKPASGGAPSLLEYNPGLHAMFNNLAWKGI